MRVMVRRTVSGLAPADEQAENELRRLPLGKLVQIELKAARNPRQHRLCFMLLKVMVEHGEFPSTDAALVALKLATGLVDYVKIDRDGTTAIVPKSISYASMPQNEFDAWFDSAIQVIVTKWLPGMTEETLRKELEDMLA